MTKIQYAVAAALALGASAAQAGITIPAGDWTIDIGGNVNAFYVNHDGKQDAGFAGINTATPAATDNQNIRTGLLPSAIGIGGKTRQNDLDIAFQFTFFVGADGNDNGATDSTAGGNNSLNVRQAYGSFGDKSWGTIKFGRDLGIFGSDAILSDMTLLGVGGGSGGVGGSSSLGRIGTGYLYADWVGQISYASPNWNGFSFNVGIRDPWAGDNAGTHENDTLGYEGKVSYEWAGDFAGKVWAGYISQNIDSTTVGRSYDARAWELGGKVGFSGFELVGNYQDGKGQGDALFGVNGRSTTVAGDENDATSWYLQGTYKLPTIGTKLGVSYGESQVETAAGDHENKSWIIGAYHPLTKSLNLVAEYQDQEAEDAAGRQAEANVISLGAIMFF